MVTAPRGPAARPGATALRPPPTLTAGDAVALFSPSSHSGRDAEAHLVAAQAALSGWGLQPLPVGEQPRHLYLAGTDAARAEAFQRLYCDPAVKGLFATRGGYGAARMLPHLDAARIGAVPPKPVVGMSDVVALFAWLHASAGVAAWHGPCLAAPSANNSPEREANLRDLQARLFRPQEASRLDGTLLQAPVGAAPVQARLVGGNLAVLTSLLGTPWAVETAGCLLFLEEVNERPYRVDRYLTQFRHAGRLDGVAGVVFGHMQDCDNERPGLLHDVLRDLFHDAPYPVVTGLPAGHGPRNGTLLLGGLARLTWSDARPGAPASLEQG